MTGELLKALRKRRGETQTQFAKHFKADQATIHRWEKYGPPASGISAALIKLVVKELKASRHA